MLQLEHIFWNTPNGTPILQDLSLTIPDGKLTVITGPNGGGKTTLAKLIAGIEAPLKGRILLDGEDITSLDITQRAKKASALPFSSPCALRESPCAGFWSSPSGKKSRRRACATPSAQQGFAPENILTVR